MGWRLLLINDFDCYSILNQCAFGIADAHIYFLFYKSINCGNANCSKPILEILFFLCTQFVLPVEIHSSQADFILTSIGGVLSKKVQSNNCLHNRIFVFLITSLMQIDLYAVLIAMHGYCIVFALTFN